MGAPNRSDVGRHAMAGNPMMNKCLGALSGGSVLERNGVGPAGRTVNNGEKMGKTSRRREGAHQINMEVGKPFCRDGNGLGWELNMAMNFGGLALKTEMAPTGDVSGKVGPNIACRN